MTNIIAGRFQQQSEVEDSIEELQRAGFARERISAFYVNPPGQHDTFPIGGDRAQSPGAKQSGKGVAAGAAAGAAAGLAAAPFLGPVGAVTGGLLGAHVGGLVGSLSTMKEQGDTGEHAEDAENAAPIRKSGMMVAVAVDDPEHEDQVVNMLRSLGAADIERAQGIIENGDWRDFNPVEPPQLVESAPQQTQAAGPRQRV
ncbi:MULTISPECIES: hypothetical protein [Oxalobacteraceae]|uniref:hypothetical protein n=1 Tax=Oxalobacteraceae TaxID=75682 RepID=UPI0010A42F95|nr:MULTISPECIES: hypothetical protein [Oxalobacteraceae]HJV51333.1 hypothetical protein [Noviherbaspirillum sp.]